LPLLRSRNVPLRDPNITLDRPEDATPAAPEDLVPAIPEDLAGVPQKDLAGARPHDLAGARSGDATPASPEGLATPRPENPVTARPEGLATPRPENLATPPLENLVPDRPENLATARPGNATPASPEGLALARPEERKFAPSHRAKFQNAIGGATVPPEEAYPGIEFLPRSSWLAWLRDRPAQCVHLHRGAPWSAKLLPDTLYLRGKRSPTRESIRPEVSLCRNCLVETLGRELPGYSGNVVAFEPDPEIFSQYFFLGVPDFERAGLRPEVARAIEERVHQTGQRCETCGHSAKWGWFSREEIPSLDEVERIREARGEWFCAEHGAKRICHAFAAIPEANLLYVNLPYGEAGAYVWI
jgi:hypothetical protein